MRTLIAAALALALTGGVALAQYYTNGPVLLSQQAPMPSSFSDSAAIIDIASGAASQRGQMNELRIQLMRQQLQQRQQR
jgi:hypothetical protein